MLGIIDGAMFTGRHQGRDCCSKPGQAFALTAELLRSLEGENRKITLRGAAVFNDRL